MRKGELVSEHLAPNGSWNSFVLSVLLRPYFVRNLVLSKDAITSGRHPFCIVVIWQAARLDLLTGPTATEVQFPA